MARALVLGLLSMMLLLAAACGGGVVPHEKLASAQAEMRAAEAGGARDVQQAALHLKLAEDQVAKAKALIDQGDTEQAAQVLDCAQVDAQLALALAREEAARKEAEAAAQQVEELKRKASKLR